MTDVFEYHQALGCTSLTKQKSLTLLKQHSLKFVPLKSVYTSLFSTGLHLQNSLLKVRKLEKIFDTLEAAKKKKDDQEMPSEKQILAWLSGFQEIQNELNACVGCLDQGVDQIHVIQEDSNPSSANPTPEPPKHPDDDEHIVAKPPIVIDDSPTEHVDEVFEGIVMKKDDNHNNNNNNVVDEIDEKLKKKTKLEKNCQDKVLNELKVVLAEKAIQREKREAYALARQKEEKLDVEDIEDPELQEEIIKKELALVMEQINDLEEEIIKTDLNSASSGSPWCNGDNGDEEEDDDSLKFEFTDNFVKNGYNLLHPPIGNYLILFWVKHFWRSKTQLTLMVP